MENEMGYILAKGPEGLQGVLGEVLNKTTADPAFKAQPHYILYEIGNQKSLIKMDFKQWPVVFWYYDLLGRSATSNVKEVLAKFAWEQCGEKEWFYHQQGGMAAYLKEAGVSEESAFLEWREKIFEGKMAAE